MPEYGTRMMRIGTPYRVAGGLLAVTLGVLASAGGVGVGAITSGGRPVAVRQPAATVLTVGVSTAGQAIAAGFVGLSMEFRALEAYAGSDPRAVNPVFEQLIRNLAPSQQPVLRIGGDSTDWTWWPVPHTVRPPGVKYVLTQRWLQVTRALSTALDAKLILGINLEADSPRVATAETHVFLGGIGTSQVQALEIGNEPELYASFPWYRNHAGHLITGRPHAYDEADFTKDFSHLTTWLPPVPLAGPSTGSPTWMKQLRPFVAAEPRLRLVTLHRYPLKRCLSSTHVTAGELLAPSSTQGLANSVVPDVAIAHAHGLPVRIDEMNSISCGGQPGVSDSFASALWSLDALFQMARVGVQGVNIHTTPGALDELFTFREVNGAWEAAVRPEYYGLMMFAQAAPPGSRLLRLSGATGDALRVWATRAPDGLSRVVVINTDPGRARRVYVRAARASGSAKLALLDASSIHATTGVTLGGQSFGAETTTGLLAGPAAATSVTAVDGRYAVTVPAGSAALLTLPKP
jgi:Glycosyl hydrolase family 79 C-terminal beta domain